MKEESQQSRDLKHFACMSNEYDFITLRHIMTSVIIISGERVPRRHRIMNVMNGR